jgi:hypothetical protein
MGFFHKSPPNPIPATPIGTDSNGERQVRVRPRRLPQPRHEELIAADPKVVRIFETLQTTYRRQKLSHLIAKTRRDFVIQRGRTRERKAWSQLLEYLTPH